MRTKSFLAAAALIAAGVLTSQAQSNVYSLNVVGYVNLTLKPGYNLIAAQLKDSSGSTQINTLLTNAPALADGSTFFGWDANTQGFTDPGYWVSPASGGPAWYDGSYENLVTITAARGKGYFIFNAGAADATLTLVGEVPQGSDVQTVANNFSFLSDFVPASQEIKTNGFPIADGATVQTWNPATQGYANPVYGVSAQSGGPAWYDGSYENELPFAPAVGQGFLHSTSLGSATWTRNFTVQ